MVFRLRGDPSPAIPDILRAMISDKANPQASLLPDQPPRHDAPLTKARRFWLTIVLLPAVLPPLGFIGWFAYNSAHLADRYREGNGFIADVQKVEADFRAYFAGKSSYGPLTLDQLVQAGALGGAEVRAIHAHSGAFTPFSSSTPDDAVVLTLRENWLSTWDFTKGDLVTTPKPAIPSPTSAFGL